MKKFYLVTVLVVSALLLRYLVPMVQTVILEALAVNDLAWLNPGNAAGIIAGYSTGGFVVVAIAVGSRQFEQFSLPKALWWCGAATLISGVFLSVDFVATRLVSNQFGFLVAVVSSALACVQVTRLKFPEYPFSAYVRGARLTTSKAIRAIRGKLPLGHLVMGADYIDRKDEVKHMLILGNVGGGKSTFISCLMAMVASRNNELWLVYDAKAELIPTLSSLGKNLVILNPLDHRSYAWDIRKDIVNRAQATAFSQILIPDEKQGENFWNLSARNILVAVIVFFIESGLDWDFRDVLLVCSNSDDLQEILKRDPKNQSIQEGLTGTHKSGGNDYLLTLNNRLRPFHVIASLWHQKGEDQRISLTQLVNSDDFNNTAIVFGSDYASGPTLNTLNHLLFERLTQLIQNLPNSRSTRIRLWLDEVTEASRYAGESLTRFLTLARGRGGAAVLGAQNYAGLVERFGEERAKQIVGLTHFRVMVGGVDGNTAQWFSEKVIGDEEVIETHIDYPQAPGKIGREGESVKDQSLGGEGTPSYKRVTRPLIPKEALLNSAIPATGPENGLTGLFSGAPGGTHWHHYSWDEIESMRVQPDPDVKAYDRISERDPAYNLSDWNSAERQKWGLPLKNSSDDEQEREAA